MSVERSTYVRTAVECQTCSARTKPLLWNYEQPPACACGGAQVRVSDTANRAHSVIGDEIDRTLEHGLCYEDGTPRRFTSRTELKRAEAASGLRILEKGERFRGDERHGRRI